MTTTKMGLEGIYNITPPFSIEPIYIYLHKKHQALVPKVANAIREMKRDGSYQKILRSTLKGVLTNEDIEQIINDIDIN